MTQATPGPWKVVNRGTHREPMMSVMAERIAGRGFSHEVAICATGDSPQFMENANAELIVRAVNERPELIAALESVIGNLMNVQIDLSTGGTKAKADKSLSEIITRARAILEKAKHND